MEYIDPDFLLLARRHIRICPRGSAFGLQLVIAVIGARFAQVAPRLDGGADMFLGIMYFLSGSDHLRHPGGRHADDAVAVAAQPVAGLHAHVASTRTRSLPVRIQLPREKIG